MMSSPDQTISILVRFREDFFAATTEIEAMFYQVIVADQHMSLPSFLLWENENINK